MTAPDGMHQFRQVRQWPLEPLRLTAGPSIQARLGIAGFEWRRARDEGLTDYQADRWAVKLGLHPATVWDDWITRGLSPLDRVFFHGSESGEPGWRQAAYPPDCIPEREVA